jgi:hypothetical protein
MHGLRITRTCKGFHVAFFCLFSVPLLHRVSSKVYLTYLGPHDHCLNPWKPLHNGVCQVQAMVPVLLTIWKFGFTQILRKHLPHGPQWPVPSTLHNIKCVKQNRYELWTFQPHVRMIYFIELIEEVHDLWKERSCYIKYWLLKCLADWKRIYSCH